MNGKSTLFLAALGIAGFGLQASAEEIQLFDAKVITASGFGADISKRYVYDSAITTAYCEGAGTAYLRTTGETDNSLIVDNYVTLNGNDGQSICTGGSDGLPVIAGTNCFSSGSSSSTHYGKPIETVFTSSATAPVSLVDGQNDLEFKLWDWGGVYGNTSIELALPENCSSRPPPFEVSLCAAQDTDIGVVTVEHDSSNLYVSFEIEQPGWYLAETHVAVGDIPTTRSGNPQPGRFPYSCEESGTLDAGALQFSCVAAIPLNDLSGDVEIAAHAAVNRLAGDGCRQNTQFASEVITVDQGLTKNGDPVASDRSDPTAVYYPDDGAPSAPYSFFSLGIGGELTIGFGAPVFNGPGADVCVQEVTNGRSSYPEELSEIYSVTNGDGTWLGEVSNRANGTGLACVDLASETADSIKLVDTTDPTKHSGNGDGYDVDWVGACYLHLGSETAWGAACYEGEGQPIPGSRNWATQFTYAID